jgi:hypothetical protein
MSGLQKNSRSETISRLLEAGQFGALKEYIETNIATDTGWVVSYKNRQGTIIDYRRTVVYRDNPAEYELFRALDNAPTWTHYFPQVLEHTARQYVFKATYDTSD